MTEQNDLPEESLPPTEEEDDLAVVLDENGEPVDPMTQPSPDELDALTGVEDEDEDTDEEDEINAEDFERFQSEGEDEYDDN